MVSDTLSAAPAGTVYDLQMAVLEGNLQRMVAATFENVFGDDSTYRVRYTTQNGIDEDVTLVRIDPSELEGLSDTRLNARNNPVRSNLVQLSDASIEELRLFSIAEGGAAGFVEKVGIFGLPTDPAEVQARSATATYTGDVYLAYTGSDPQTINGSGSGTASVTADFDALTLSGTAMLDAGQVGAGAGDFLTGATLDLDGTISTGNDFSGTVSLGSAAAGSTLTALDGQLDGAFFGQGASSLGGTFAGTLTTTDQGSLGVVGGVAAKE